MINFLMAFAVFLILFIALFYSIRAGFNYGIRKHTKSNSERGIVKVAEGTVFAIFGLLIAFSFSGAYDRFEQREFKIINEINAFETAYYRINLLAPDAQENMRNVLKNYLDERIHTYEALTEFAGIEKEIKEFKAYKDLVWKEAIKAVQITNDHSATLLFIPAINNLFDIANERLMITKLHPPGPIFLLLIGLGMLTAFLAGYNMAKSKIYNIVYIVVFTAITAFTIYIIIDLEFPRLGMIRVDRFDNMLIEQRDSLRSPAPPANIKTE